MARSPEIFPNLRVTDPKSEIDWLVRILGFEAHFIGDYGGQILHAELRMGDQLLFLQPDKPDDAYGMHSPQKLNGTNQCVCIAVEDVEAVAARVRAAEGEMITPPHDTPYGAREFSCRSPDGHVWSIGNYWGQPRSANRQESDA
jgi:uncharacterized glyoxalase superfamily protein PhnB